MIKKHRIYCLYDKKTLSLRDEKHMFIKNKVPVNGKKLEKKVALHGCAIIFSKQYIEKITLIINCLGLINLLGSS